MSFTSSRKESISQKFNSNQKRQDKVIKLLLSKILKRFDSIDRTLKVNKMIEEEIKQYIQSNRHMNETHLTKIEVKIKRLLLAERANQKQTDVSINQNENTKNDNYIDSTIIANPSNKLTLRPARQIMNSPVKGTEYGINGNTIVIENNKTQRVMTQSVDLIKRDQTMDYSVLTEARDDRMPSNHSRLSTIQRRIPKFKENDDLSYLTGEDEWNEIEKYNAMAERHDKFMKAISIHNKQQRFQETLRKQIKEQNVLKQRQILEEK